MALVYGPFCILKVSAICCSAYSFYISTIAFLIAAACCMTEGNSISNLTIQGQALKTKSIGIWPFKLAILLIALKAIYRAIFLLILGISVIIIQQAYYSRLQQRFTILMELCDLTKIDFIIILKVIVQYLNSLLIKFFPASVVIKSSSLKQLSIQYICRIFQVYLILISYSHLLV